LVCILLENFLFDSYYELLLWFMIVLKKENAVFLIDIAISGGLHLANKSVEKYSKYVALKIEVVKV